MIAIDNNALYSAFMAKDARFDGRFFIGISSTGIYCRPVCRAKQPKIENCTFFTTAAEAEQAGYRPCLLCRPELAPGSSITDATATLVQRARKMLEANCGSEQNLEELAGKLGYTDRHLRRAFAAEYNVSPIQYLQTCRLLLAKNLLTDTNLSVLEVAMAAGFGSLRRFNSLFKKHYNLTPTALRKRMPKEKKLSSSITLTLCYRPPYRWEEMLNFLAMRAIPEVEIIKEKEYFRTVHLLDADKNHIYGWIQVSHKPNKNALTITVNETLLPVLSQVLAKVRQLFDLHCDPETVYETLEPMNNIRPGLHILGTRLPGSFSSFEMAVRAVLGQQITVKAANTLAARLVKAHGKPIQTDIENLTHVFPSPEDILALEGPIENHLGPLGIIRTRAKAIYELAKSFEQDEIDYDYCLQPEIEMKKLLEISGIGNWTAQYIAMRTMGWTDVFLETDVGVKKALKPYTPKQMLEIAESWRPWRSYATISLWNSL
ncbi:MAG TPA: AlkA N-terminal domain-containing protein [Syntrophomonadaceae bacterium]|nr:AlkA N-terminal domain-containing protein [Syntrophomonadaceae bacterium]